MPDDSQCLPYRRARFSTRLPTDRRYVASHFWLREVSPGLWRIGFTKFAARMLGDLVEHGFSVKVGDRVEVGQVIGWIEGFKAVTDLYCIASGEFAGTNPDLEKDPELADKDPYERGWLYAVRGAADPDSLTAEEYAQRLDVQIDRMMQQRHDVPPAD